MTASEKIDKSLKKYITVQDWGKHHAWPPEGGLRHLIFNRKTNGFDLFGVIIKVGKRILIDETAFFDWVANHGEKK